MSFLQGVNLLHGRLVYHTGTMIRFTSGQLGSLPPDDQDCVVILPDGAVVNGHFKRNPANPYIGGPALVRWIKSWVPYNKPTPVIVHQVGVTSRLRLEIGSTPARGEEAIRKSRALARTRNLKRLNTERRRRSYEAWERNPTLRLIALDAWGPKCQVSGCRFLRPIAPHIRGKMVDVHHLNHVAAGGSDSPMNICILCVVHHQLIHRGPTVVLQSWDLDGATVLVNGLTLEIERDARKIL